MRKLAAASVVGTLCLLLATPVLAQRITGGISGVVKDTSGAVLTGAGKLDYKGIIHVAGISMWWRSSERSVRASIRSALRVASE